MEYESTAHRELKELSRVQGNLKLALEDKDVARGLAKERKAVLEQERATPKRRRMNSGAIWNRLLLRKRRLKGRLMRTWRGCRRMYNSSRL